jgi:hypothetical protein
MTRSSALISLCLLGLLIAPACTDDGPNTDEVDVTGDGDGDSSTGDGDTSDTTDDDASTSSDTSTTETSESTTTDTTDDATDTTDDATDTTDSTTGDPDNSVYSAVALPGGLDRVLITRVDPDAPSCSEMVLVLPGFDAYSIDLPAMWAIEQIRVWDQLECDPGVTIDALGEDGFGTLEFLGTDAFDLYPCALAIDAEIELDTDPPSSMNFVTDFVMVDGVNCG